MTLAERLRLTREWAGLTQAQLAKAAGISQPSIHQLESGQTKQFRSSTLLKVAKALGQSPEWLANGEGEPRPISALQSLRQDEDELVASYRKLASAEKKFVLRMVRAIVNDK